MPYAIYNTSYRVSHQRLCRWAAGLLLLISTNFSLQAQPRNPHTDWFSHSRYGLFVHFLPSGPNFQREINAFDVRAFAQDCADAGAGYVFFTLGQNSGYHCSPNATYDRLAGYKAGEHSSLRDLPLDLAEALATHNIRLMLYVSGDVPAEDSVIARRLGARNMVKNENGENWVYNDTLVRQWGAVMQEWSDRYGSKVAGWWVDGCYAKSHFSDSHGQTYVKALKHGNPKAIVALNSGLHYETVSLAQDYLAGEERDLRTGYCPGRWHNGAQWHELGFLGKDWGTGEPSCSAAQLTKYLKTEVNANGGVLTMDVRLDGSHIYASHLSILKAVKAGFRQKP